MKNLKYILIALSFCIELTAQRSTGLSASQIGTLQLHEKKMQRIGMQFLSDSVQANRLKGARDFIKLLIDAMKVENSFQYRFDSLPYLAKVMPEDSSFKIYTFQVMLDNYTFRHYGCIQLNRKEIKIIPFKDYSDTFKIPPQIPLTHKNWLGAVYYKIITKKIENKPVYFLFGYDQNDLLTDKKYIEVMTIDKDSIARFGLPLFEKTITERVEIGNKLGQMQKKPIPPVKKTINYHRYVLEYRKKASVILKFDKEKDLITHDHVESLDAKVQDVAFMKVPDGSYEGLKWNGAKWIWQEYIKLADKETNGEIRPVPLKQNKNIPKK